MDSLKVKTLFSWPYLPTHFILGLIVIVSSLSFFLVESSIQWVWYPFVIWGIYIGLLFFFCRIRLSFYRELLQAGIPISIMMSLYLLLGYLAFAVIPWNGDRLLSEIDQWLGFGGIPVVTFGHLCPDLRCIYPLSLSLYFPLPDESSGSGARPFHVCGNDHLCFKFYRLPARSRAWSNHFPSR